MFWYILKLLILLPLIGFMIWGSLKLAKKMQGQFGAPTGGSKAVRIVETTMLSPTLRLAVIEFHGREILVSTSRNGLTRLAEAPARVQEEDVVQWLPGCRRSLPRSPRLPIRGWRARRPARPPSRAHSTVPSGKWRGPAANR